MRMARVEPGLGILQCRKWELESNRRRNINVAFLFFIAALTCSFLCEVAVAQNEPVTGPPGFHLLLRPEGGKTSYKLGEPIILEVACYSDLPQRYDSYSASCWNRDSNELALNDAEVVPLDANSKIPVDPVQTLWIGRTLCPSTQYPLVDDTPANAQILVGTEARWQKMTLTEHYPMSGGHFRIRVSIWGQFGFTASSMPVEINVVDDPQERAATLRGAIEATKALDPFSTPATAFAAEYGKVEYFPDLESIHWLISDDGYEYGAATRYPDRAATAKFVREYLDTKVSNDIRLKENVEAALALELAATSPKLYARALRFQGALGEPSRRDLRDLRAWLLPRYRQLLVEIARSMVTIHKQAPGSFEDENLELKAEELVSVNVPECTNTPNFLSEGELRHFMHEAGLSPEFITEQMAEMRQAMANLSKSGN
jgi:hypothetical protein